MSESLLPLDPERGPWGPATAWREAEGVEAPARAPGGGLATSAEALASLSALAFREVSHFLRPSHLAQVRAVYDDPESSDNDRFVALELLKNACVAAGGTLPMCQDTGTAVVHAWRGARVSCAGGGEERALEEGAARAWREGNLRHSQMAPLSMYEERNTRTNLPAEVEILLGEEAPDEYRLLFVAKGGGSANKTRLLQEAPSALRPDRLMPLLAEQVRALGASACPPYHLAVVVGGTTAEFCVRAVKLASCRMLDALPTSGSEGGRGFRDLEAEAALLEEARRSGLGAQFGGRHLCHDVRVVRLPRHGASLPIGVGVSCSADRQALARITPGGVLIEALERDPARFLPDEAGALDGAGAERIDLNRPMGEVRAALSRLPVSARVSLTGPLTVARDAAHARIAAAMERGEEPPAYMRDHPVYYAGPARRPEGMASGSFGPTTAGRMDSFVEGLQARGCSLVTLAKGNRSRAVAESCRRHGGFHLGSIGGAAARLAERCIRRVEAVDFEDLGMEAVWRIEVEDFPAFVVIDDKGSDFYRGLRPS